MTEDAEKLKQMLADTVVLIAGLLGDEAARAVLQDEITRLKRSRPRGRPKKGADFTTAVGLLGRTEKKTVRAEKPTLNESGVDSERKNRWAILLRSEPEFIDFYYKLYVFAHKNGLDTNFRENEMALAKAALAWLERRRPQEL
jgi:hypothetical protein